MFNKIQATYPKKRASFVLSIEWYTYWVNRQPTLTLDHIKISDAIKYHNYLVTSLGYFFHGRERLVDWVMILDSIVSAIPFLARQIILKNLNDYITHEPFWKKGIFIFPVYILHCYLLNLYFENNHFQKLVPYAFISVFNNKMPNKSVFINNINCNQLFLL